VARGAIGRLGGFLIAAALAGCAVKGYDIGWRGDPIAALLGRPLDALSGCRHAEGAEPPAPACAGLVRDVRALLASLPPGRDVPEVLGARCGADACSYVNAYERRDVGLALVLPVFRKVVLREARARFVRGPDSRWRLDLISVADRAPPTYGPVRIGGAPPPPRLCGRGNVKVPEAACALRIAGLCTAALLAERWYTRSGSVADPVAGDRGRDHEFRSEPMTSLTISRSLPSLDFSSFLHELGRAIDSMAEGARAAHEYERLRGRSGSALAREGIARSDIPRVVFERNFA
jgi:hypothetical protein